MKMEINNQYTLTTEHPASSYRIPVLADKSGRAFGPSDILPVPEKFHSVFGAENLRLNTAARLVLSWAEETARTAEEIAAAKNYLGQWPEGPQIMGNVYSDTLNQEFSLIELDNKYGTITHDGKTLYLTNQAHVDNHKDGVAYYAVAIDVQGNTYKVMWLTTPEWDAAMEHEQLKCNIENSEIYGEDIDPDVLARFSELDKADHIDVSDESNACDWFEPYKITQI